MALLDQFDVAGTPVVKDKSLRCHLIREPGLKVHGARTTASLTISWKRDCLPRAVAIDEQHDNASRDRCRTVVLNRPPSGHTIAAYRRPLRIRYRDCIPWRGPSLPLPLGDFASGI
jgi:hypothetical protein